MILKKSILVSVLCWGMASLQAEPKPSEHKVMQESHKINQHEVKVSEKYTPMHPLNQNPRVPVRQQKMTEKKVVGKKLIGINYATDQASLAKIAHNMELLGNAATQWVNGRNGLPPYQDLFIPCTSYCLVSGAPCAEYSPDGDLPGKGLTVPVDGKALYQCFQEGIQGSVDSDSRDGDPFGYTCYYGCGGVGVNPTGASYICGNDSIRKACSALCCQSYQNLVDGCLGYPPATVEQSCKDFMNLLE